MKKIIGLIAAALMLAAGVAQAVTYTWDGQTDGNWGTAANWDTGSQTWNLNAIAEFNAVATSTTNVFLGAANRIVRGLNFNASADSSIGINLADSNGTTARNLTLFSFLGGAQTINVDSGAAADIRIFGPGNFALGAGTGGSVTNLIINHSGGGDLSIESQITSSTGFGVVKNGTGALTLAPSVASIYKDFTLNDGRVRIGGTQVATALGTNIVTLNGGTLSSDSTTALTNSQALVFGGNVTLGHTNDNGELTLNGTADLGGATRTITADSAVTLGGVIGNGGLTKAGGSTLTLSGTNTYSGVTTVSDGTLTLADNAGMTFVIGANGVNNKLTGKGTAALAGDFYFDLTSAGTTTGDSWTIANVSNQTFDATFTVNGFTAAGGGKWIKIINGTSYEFSQSTSVLRVNVGSERKISLVIIQ